MQKHVQKGAPRQHHILNSHSNKYPFHRPNLTRQKRVGHLESLQGPPLQRSGPPANQHDGPINGMPHKTGTFVPYPSQTTQRIHTNKQPTGCREDYGASEETDNTPLPPTHTKLLTRKNTERQISSTDRLHRKHNKHKELTSLAMSNPPAASLESSVS